VPFDERLLKPVRGMRDWTPEEYAKLLAVVKSFAETAESYGYLRVDTPALEHFEILKAKAGEEVEKEIYYFKDKAGREVGLRFDLTVPIARMVSYRVDFPKPIRWYYVGKVWRYDEPQHGRYREFHQYGIELIGASSPTADAEVISVAVDSSRRAGLDGFRVEVNDRELMDFIMDRLDVPRGLRLSIYRVLDKRDRMGEDEILKKLMELGLRREQIEELVQLTTIEKPLAEVASVFDELKVPSKFADRYQRIGEVLKSLGLLEYVVYKFSVVRGLDYYTGMVFEIRVPEYRLAVGGGGRYDELIEVYYGRRVPAAGFAIGVERFLEALELQGRSPIVDLRVDYYVYPIGECLELAARIATSLRRRGYKVILDTGEKSLRAALEYADKIGVRNFVIVGGKEISRGVVKVRNMEKWLEEEVPIEALIE